MKKLIFLGALVAMSLGSCNHKSAHTHDDGHDHSTEVHNHEQHAHEEEGHSRKIHEHRKYLHSAGTYPGYKGHGHGKVIFHVYFREHAQKRNNKYGTNDKEKHTACAENRFLSQTKAE